jgi:uncharacterized membrane protein
VEHSALFLHLLGAFTLVAGVVVASVAFEAARRRRTAGEVALLLRLSRAGVVLVGIGTLLVLPFGLWLVHLESWGYGAGWIDAAIVLLALALVLGALGGRRPKRARKLATRLADEGREDDPELRALLDDPLTRAVNVLAALSLLAVIALMVWKPGA